MNTDMSVFMSTYAQQASAWIETPVIHVYIWGTNKVQVASHIQTYHNLAYHVRLSPVPYKTIIIRNPERDS